jgi:hypothetical protein
MENIIDDYCALLAATDLFAVTGKDAHRAAAVRRAGAIVARQHDDGWFWADDAQTRSFFHAADAGLLYVALMRFIEVLGDEPSAGSVRDAVRRGLRFELDVTNGGVNNPFEYPRQYVLVPGQVGREQFFYPHENPSGYWWQGENARLASLACAAHWAGEIFADDAALVAELRRFAQASVDWIFGFNPFDIAMMHGWGHNNPRYDTGSANAPGGVANGITAGFTDEDDIDFIWPWETDSSQSWRWGEQWIPHGSWLFAALCHQQAAAIPGRS